MVGLRETRRYVLPNFSAIGTVGHTNLHRFYSRACPLRLASFIACILYSYPLVVQPLYIGADHPSYISKKVHKISVFMYFRPKKWILQVRFAP